MNNRKELISILDRLTQVFELLVKEDFKTKPDVKVNSDWLDNIREATYPSKTPVQIHPENDPLCNPPEMVEDCPEWDDETLEKGSPLDPFNI